MTKVEELKIKCEDALTKSGLVNIMYTDKFFCFEPTEEHVPVLQKILNLINEYMKLVEPIREMPLVLFNSNIETIIEKLYKANEIRQRIYNEIKNLS